MQISQAAINAHFVFVLIFFSLVCSSHANSGSKDIVTVYKAPKGAPVSSDYSVEIGGKQVDVYAVKDARFAYCDISGPADVTVKANFAEPDKVYCMSLHPLSKKYKTTRKGNELRFRLEEPENVTILINGNHRNRALHLFLNPPAPPVPKDAVYFGPGLHKLNPEKPISISKGQTLYIDGGAWVEAVVLIRNADDITITGRGVLTATRTKPVRFRRALRVYGSRNVKINGIIIAKEHGPGWCSQIIDCDNVSVRNLRVVAPDRPSTDGINPCNSRNVLIEDCFLRTGDDCIAVKGNTAGPVKTSTNIDPQTQPPVENITVRRCQLWSQFNNVICIGAETWARHFDTIRFEDCDILYHGSRRSATMSILPTVGTEIRNIIFSDIRVEYTISKLFLFNIAEGLYSIPGNHKFPGDISNVTIENIDVLKLIGSPRSEFKSRIKNKSVRNVSIKGVRYNGTLMHNAKRMGLIHQGNVRFLDKPEPSEESPARSEPNPKLGRLWLTFYSGFNEEKGGNKSKGVRITVQARKAKDKMKRTLLNTVVQPTGKWKSHAVNLSGFADSQTVIRLSVEPGWDTDYDWFQLGNPRIIEITGGKPKVLIGPESICNNAKVGITLWPCDALAPLAHGAVTRVRVDENTQALPVVGGIRKPGVIMHPAYDNSHSAPVCMQWTVALK